MLALSITTKLYVCVESSSHTFFSTTSCLPSLARQVYRGYVDDARNTDNAWIETRAINYHDDDGTLTADLKLRVNNRKLSIPFYIASQHTTFDYTFSK